jgi:hypothetical protein
MNQTYPQGGLAALLASKGRKGDSVLVHMTPGEVEGLQALALATGGSLTTNPDTGLPEANWLKSILPAIAGSALKTFFPKMGSATTGLIVGGITGLVDKSFDKGLRSGLSAYSGAKTIEGLEAARKAVQPGAAVPKIVSGEEEVSSARLRDTRTPIDLSKIKVETAPVQTVTKAPSLFGDGVRALFKPEGQEAFLEAVEGPYKRQGLRDLSRSAYFAGLANLLAQEPKKIQPGSTGSNARFYVPGEVNPLYGQGYDQWYFKPGYFSDKYPGYAEGGEVMVSPQAVLPQTLSVSQPAFTQDREELKDYYESLLAPPGPPRDISDLNAYLDDLRNRLKRPYQPVSGSDWQYGQLPTGGTGGSGPASGGTVTPPGNDPFATGVTGTPVDFIKPPELPPPPKPREDLTPPSSVAPGATPGDLGFLFGTPPEFFVPGTEAESNVEEMEPETETSIEVFDPENIASDYVGAPASVGVPGAGLPKKKPPPEQDTQTSIEVFDPKNIASDYAGAPVSVAPPTGSSFPARTGYISTKENPFGYDFVELGFVNPQTTQEVADASEPIVDEILKNFEEQQKAENEKKKEEYKELGMAALTELAKLAVPGLGTILEIKKAIEEKKAADEKKGIIKIETDEQAEGEQKEEEKPAEPPASTGRTGGGYSPFLPSLSQERFGLAKAAGDDVFGPTYSGTIYDESGNIIEENTDYDKGFAGGGYVPGYAQGGLGSMQQYAVGGKLLNGAGDGMSDDIKANINGTQEARLADGEFVIPADVVSHLGNGSTDAGAKQLYAMMDRIRKARTGRTKQAPEVKARKYMPA